MSNLASLRIGKVNQGTETAVHNHNLRASLSKKETNVNRELTFKNEILLGRRDTIKAINEKIDSLNLKTAVRKDANRAIEFVLSASPEHFYDFEKAGITRDDWDKITIENLGQEKYWSKLKEIKQFEKKENIENWKKNIVKWVQSDPDLKDNLINLVLHDDEKTIHAHLVVTPVINNRLTAKEFFTPSRTKHWQDTYAIATGLDRGISSDKKHEDKKEYDVKQAMRKGYNKGYKRGKTKGHQEGYQEGYQEGLEHSTKLGVKVGSIFDGLKSQWHTPSKAAKDELEAIKKATEQQIDRDREEAQKKVSIERRRTRTLEDELARKTNIVNNLEADNKRLSEDLKTEKSHNLHLTNEVRRLKIKAGEGGSGGSGTDIVPR